MNQSLKIWHLLLGLVTAFTPTGSYLVDMGHNVELLKANDLHQNEYIIQSRKKNEAQLKLLIKISSQLETLQKQTNRVEDQQRTFKKDIENFYYLNSDLKKPGI